MKIKLITISKNEAAAIEELFADYTKRLKHYTSLEIIQLKPSSLKEEANLNVSSTETFFRTIEIIPPNHLIAKKQMKLGGGVVAFELKGGVKAGKKFLDALKMISLSANLGDTRTIATHPASTTHSKLTEEERLAAGITPGLVRISAGLENIEDIIADIAQAIAHA